MATTQKRLNHKKNKKSKRQVNVETLKKWQQSYKKEHALLVWLCCDEDKSLVSVLSYAICREYEMKIAGHKKFLRV